MAYLEIKEGPCSGTTFPLAGKVTLGRNSSNQLHLNDSSVSRQHAEIWHKEDYFALVDLGSVNGSYVNGDRLHQLVPKPLYDSDEIVLGISKLIFHAEGQEPPGSVKKEQLVTGDENSDPFLQTNALSAPVKPALQRHPMVNMTLDASRVDLFKPNDDSTSALLSTIKRLQAMVKIANDLGAILKPDALAERIMKSIFDIFPHADRAYFMFTDSKTGELIPLATRRRGGLERETATFPVSRTVIQTVVDQQQSILLSDARNDERFADHQSVVNLSIRSLMCVPLICKDELLGVLGVDTMSRQHAFDADDLTMLTGIASQAAVALKNAELYTAVENETLMRTQLSRYLSRDVVEGVLEGTIPLSLGGEKKWGTLLFCDIVGFTSLAENLSALDVVKKLNRYYRLVTEIVTRHKGTLHKFGGDMVMAFWNVMVPDEKACENALRCGLEMQNTIFSFDIRLEYEGQRLLFLGVGCNTGGFAGGNIGGEERMEYTVVGDNVNLAQRIESLACRWQVLVAEETYMPVSQGASAIRLPSVLVKGRVAPITVYSVRGMQLADGSMLLTIPLVVMTPEGMVSGSGLATDYRIVNGRAELQVITVAAIPAWSTLIVQFDLPELTAAPRITGKVATLQRCSYEEKAPYSQLVLTDLTGDAAALMLLQPGKCIDSRKSWEEMKRH